MSKDEIKDRKRKVEGSEVTEHKTKHHKKEKKHHKKEKKEKKEKKHKKEKESEETETTAEPVTESKPVSNTSGYVQNEELTNVAQSEIDEFLKENEVAIEDPAKMNLRPLLSFSHVSLNKEIQSEIAKFPKPTPIQAASWPYLLSGRDVIGVAETGSGKTFAFGVPAVNALVQNGDNKKQYNGIKVLAISPTRELASQIYDNLIILTDKVGLECCCVYGGVPKDDQRRQLKKSDIVVATPGRLLDLLQEGSVDLSNVNYLVLDEGDRMLEKGFEEDIK